MWEFTIRTVSHDTEWNRMDEEKVFSRNTIQYNSNKNIGELCCLVDVFVAWTYLQHICAVEWSKVKCSAMHAMPRSSSDHMYKL